MYLQNNPFSDFRRGWAGLSNKNSSYSGLRSIYLNPFTLDQKHIHTYKLAHWHQQRYTWLQQKVNNIDHQSKTLYHYLALFKCYQSLINLYLRTSCNISYNLLKKIFCYAVYLRIIIFRKMTKIINYGEETPYFKNKYPKANLL